MPVGLIRCDGQCPQVDALPIYHVFSLADPIGNVRIPHHIVAWWGIEVASVINRKGLARAGSWFVKSTFPSLIL